MQFKLRVPFPDVRGIAIFVLLVCSRLAGVKRQDDAGILQQQMRNGGGMHGFVAPTACGINDASQNESSVRSLCHILQPFMAQCRSSPNMYLIKLDGAPPDLLVASEMMMVTGGALSPCHLLPIAKNKKLPRSRISFAPVLCTAWYILSHGQFVLEAACTT